MSTTSGPALHYFTRAVCGLSIGPWEQVPVALVQLVRARFNLVLDEAEPPGHEVGYGAGTRVQERPDIARSAQLALPLLSFLLRSPDHLAVPEPTAGRIPTDIDLTSGYRMSVFLTAIPADAEPHLNDYEQLARIVWMTRDEIEQALETPPDVRRQALDLVDQALSDTTTIIVTTTAAARRGRRRTPGAKPHTG